MKKGAKKEQTTTTTDSNMINNNEILLSLEGWLKYIEGFAKGLSSCDRVDSSSVLDCVSEVLEYMVSMKNDLKMLLAHCECILQENEDLKLIVNEIKKGETKNE